jgi:hypothetical protein
MEGRAKQIDVIILWAEPGLGWIKNRFFGPKINSIGLTNSNPKLEESLGSGPDHPLFFNEKIN